MTDFFQEFQEFRKILCLCPCCAGLYRVSDLKLKTIGAAKTWLDAHEEKESKMDRKEEKFKEVEEELREIARKKGRKAAEKVFNRSVLPSFKKLGLDPFDVKPLLNPVDFIVFKGMNSGGSISNIIFLSRKYNVPALNAIQGQIKKAVLRKQYDWQVARINDTGKIVFE